MPKWLLPIVTSLGIAIIVGIVTAHSQFAEMKNEIKHVKETIIEIKKDLRR